MRTIKDYTEEVLELREVLYAEDIREFYSISGDTPLVAKVLNILANEEHMSTSRANAILTDAITILPFISTI